jgi:peptide/nickel transport system substrate-binding protein
MKKFRWQLLILFLTGLVVGVLLILEKRGGLGQLGNPEPVAGGVYTEALIGSLSRLCWIPITNRIKTWTG